MEYEAGRRALDDGAPERAAAHFAAASLLDPNSAALPAWHADALERAGRRDAALLVLDGALSRLPAERTLRYNRAALRMRSGDEVGAISDLRALYGAGLAEPDEVGRDPDFAALSANPATASLAPAPRIDVAGVPEAGAVLLGEDWSVEVTFAAPVGLACRFVDAPPAPGPLRLRRVVEDLLAERSGTSGRRVELHYEAVAAGAAALGPWTLQCGDLRAVVGPWPVDVRDGVVAGGSDQRATISALLPSEWVSAGAGAGQAITPVGLVVSDAPGAELQPAGLGIRMEHRRAGQPDWRAWVLPADAAGWAVTGGAPSAAGEGAPAGPGGTVEDAPQPP